MTESLYAKLTVNLWRAKQRAQAKPRDKKLRAVLVLKLAALCKEILEGK